MISRTDMSKNIEIIVGTYEEFLLGYKLTHKNGEQALTQSFADKSHTGSIKCLSVQGKYIATGGTDDRIFIYDMKKRKQSQILLNHEGTVNAIAFTSDNTHILSAGDDGRMVAVRLNTWQVGANWTKAHNGAKVTHISCHPSGKLALSLGSDLILRTWNLVKGRVAYKTNLKSKLAVGSTPDCLSWSPEGEYFSITGPRNIDIWSIKNADIHKSDKTKSKPICVSWCSDEVLVCGMEDGTILFVSVDENDETVSINAHNSRVKAISISDDTLVSASSSGELKLWQIDISNRKLKQVAVTNIGCRPTCIGILDLDQFGTEYLTTQVPVVQEETPKIQVEEIAPKERGVVTIEYDDDTDEEATAEVLEENEKESKSQKNSKKRKCTEESKSDGKLSGSKASGKKTKKNQKVNGSKNAT